MFQNGGLAWQGGFIFGFASGLWYVRKKKLALLTILDLVAPYIALGQAIGRIGCFFNGCCYGREVSWGIYFPTHQAQLHPTQLYSATGLFVIFLLLKNVRRRLKTPGLLLVLYLMLASQLRFVIEFFRADNIETAWGLTVFQFVSLGLFCLGVVIFLLIKKLSREKP